MAAGLSEAERGIRPVILVVDDDPGLRESFRLILEDEFDLLEALDGTQALDILRAHHVDLVLLDIRLPDLDGIEVLERIKTFDEQVEVILVTAVQTVRTAVAAMKLGAFDYVTKPFEEEEFLALVRRALGQRALHREVDYLRGELARELDFEELVGRHHSMQKLYGLIANVARTPVTVLVMGESGTGKELVARAIHRQGPRREGPFVPINLAAMSDTLMESELFGHEKGAFTGAYQKRVGKFELAQGGTLFLDEVAALRVDLQAKMLRALQEREIERLGGIRRIKIDARVIAATNADLPRAVRGGAFREDLYYRLNVVQIAVPPLRARKEDVPLLARHFIQKYNQRFGRRVAGVSRDALRALTQYSWPGNVRELENIIERAVALSDGPTIERRDLPLDLMLPETLGRGESAEAVGLKDALEQFERQLVLRVLERVGWNQAEAARRLGLHRNTLNLKLAAWGIRRPR